MMTNSFHTKSRGALYGLCVGDALSMPVHWYYNRQALNQDYGRVKDYLAPHNPHPDSILWRSSYKAPNARGEILHDQALTGVRRVFIITSFSKRGRTL